MIICKDCVSVKVHTENTTTQVIKLTENTSLREKILKGLYFKSRWFSGLDAIKTGGVKGITVSFKLLESYSVDLFQTMIQHEVVLTEQIFNFWS